MPGSDASGAAKAALRLAAALAAALLLFAAPVPYVIYEPGVAVPVDGLVKMGGAGADARDSSHITDRQGEWLLTTVYLRARATPWAVIASAWRADREAHAKRAVFGGSGAGEYEARMGVLMAESQSKAVEAAYRAAGVPYASAPDGVFVTRGGGPLKAGDRIAAADGMPVHGLDELAEALRGRAGREAELTVLRGGQEIAVRLAVDEADADEPADGLAGSLGGAELTEITAIVRRIPPQA